MARWVIKLVLDNAGEAFFVVEFRIVVCFLTFAFLVTSFQRLFMINRIFFGALFFRTSNV